MVGLGSWSSSSMSRRSAERALHDVLRDGPSWIGVLGVKRFPLVEFPPISLSPN